MTHFYIAITVNLLIPPCPCPRLTTYPQTILVGQARLTTYFQTMLVGQARLTTYSQTILVEQARLTTLSQTMQVGQAPKGNLRLWQSR